MERPTKNAAEYSWDKFDAETIKAASPDGRKAGLMPPRSPHPELDGAFAPNLLDDDPINRCSAYRRDGSRKMNLTAAVQDAQKCRAMTALERDLEIRRTRKGL